MLRLGEEPQQRRALGDREAAHLDQARLALLGGERPEQVEEEIAAGGVEVGRRGRLELGDGGVEALARDDLVQAANLATEGEPPGEHRGDLAGADPLPPEALQLLQELLRA